MLYAADICQLLGRHFPWGVILCGQSCQHVPSLVLESYLLSVVSVLVAGITLPCLTFSQSCPRDFFFSYILSNPFSSYHPKYLSTTSPSSSLYPNYLLVCPNVFQDYHNSLLIIFPAFCVFSSNPFFTKQLELRI